MHSSNKMCKVQAGPVQINLDESGSSAILVNKYLSGIENRKQLYLAIAGRKRFSFCFRWRVVFTSGGSDSGDNNVHDIVSHGCHRSQRI